MTWPWPWSRRRQRLELLDADAKVTQAATDRRRAEKERDQAKELGDWARQTNLADRFDLRLQAAYRTQIGRERPT